MELVLKFLKDLSKHNDREWFEKNKHRYLQAKETYENLIGDVLKEVVKFDDSLGNLEAKKLIFRIYRDVRFSKDKRPYKTNMGAGFSPNGKLVEEPGYYLHIEPGKSFVAGGIYMPNAGNLAKIRQEIDYNAEGFNKIVGSKKFKSLYKAFDVFDKLKTAPKGYPKDHPMIEVLKLKSIIVSKELSDKEVLDKKFAKTVGEHCRQIKPLNDFIRNALA
ncbi:MAG TPA: DUF2461 domain-containing protein [Chryseosolibacter sp.]|nr:DUF2461 domain-containing protein [Chryseosolibacter sp.]